MSSVGGRAGLAGLFAVAHGQPVQWTDTDHAKILEHQLGCSVLDNAHRNIGATASQGLTYRDLLIGKNPLREHLLAAKDYFKCADIGDDAIPFPVAYTLYVATIAAGLLAGMRISSLEPTELQSGFDWALQQPWLDREVARMISTAADLVGDGNV